MHHLNKQFSKVNEILLKLLKSVIRRLGGRQDYLELALKVAKNCFRSLRISQKFL